MIRFVMPVAVLAVAWILGATPASAVSFTAVSGSCEIANDQEADGLAVQAGSGDLWASFGGGGPNLLAQSSFVPGGTCQDQAGLSQAAEAVDALPNGNLVILDGLRVFELQLTGGPAPTIDFTVGTAERIVFHPDRGTLFIGSVGAIPGTGMVTEYDTSGVAGASFTTAFDIQGMTTDPATGNLLLSNGDALSVEEFATDGSIVESHDLGSLLLSVEPGIGASDLEGLALDPDTGALFLGTDSGMIHRLVPEPSAVLLVSLCALALGRRRTGCAA